MSTSRNKPQFTTVAIQRRVYDRVKEVADQRQTTIQNFINDNIDLVVSKYSFLKAYAPQISLEHVTENAMFLNDKNKEETIIIKIKNENIDDLNTPTGGIVNVLCETCKSDSCIHVRYSLALPELSRLRPLRKTA